MAREGLKEWRSRIEKIVREGISSGEIRKDLEPRALANTVIATLEGALMIARLEASRTALNDAKTHLARLLKDAAVR